MNKLSLNELRLPASSSNEDLETISRSKLQILFDTKLFEVRSENQRDKGIDLIIEIKQDNRYTNFRFAVQLKSTESLKLNKDGSLSFAIEINNINYLLNYGMPAYYILYEHNSGKFYWESVNQVYQNLTKKYTPPKFPEKFKVRFFKLFTDQAIGDIYEHTLENGILFRRINSHLKFPITDSKVPNGIVIDAENEVYSVEQNIAFINQFGFALLNKGDSNGIIEIERRTHPRTTASSTFNLVCGIAYFQTGNLFKAIEFLKLAQQNSSEFNSEIQLMLTYTLIHAKYLLGMTNKRYFQQELDKLMEAPNLPSFLQIEKEYGLLSHRKVNTEDNLQSFYASIEKIVSKEKNNPKARVMAYAQILRAESAVLFCDLAKNFFLLSGCIDPQKTNTYKHWLLLENQYLERLKSLGDFAIKQNDFLALMNIGSAKIDWTYTKLYYLHTFKNINKRTFTVKQEIEESEQNSVLELLNKLDKTFEGYQRLEHKENMVTALFSKYELLHFASRRDEAKTVAQSMLDIIETNELNGLRPRYNELIDCGTHHEKFIEKFTNHVRSIYEVARNSNIGVEFLSLPISEEGLAIVEESEQWSIDKFFEFEFPASDQPG